MTLQAKSTSVAKDVLLGKERTVSFAGVGQDRAAGLAGSQLSAMNFARIALEIEVNNKGLIADTITQLATKDTIENSVNISRQLPDRIHVEIEDIYRVPIFEKSLKLASSTYGLPTSDRFEGLLQDMRNIPSSVATIIVRSPEVVVCMKLQNPGNDIFLVFNPHLGADRHLGATLLFGCSLEAISVHLLKTFPVEKHHGNLHWQASLLANYSGFMFVHRAPLEANEIQECLILSSLTILTLKAEISQLRQQNGSLVVQNEELEQQVIELREEGGKVRPAQMQGNLRRPSLELHRSDNEHSPEFDASLEFALRLQATFDSEDAELIAQKEELLRGAQRQYHCGICLEDFPEDDAVRLDSCGHELCRDCARGHVFSKIEEHRFPIVCPLCAVDHAKRNPSTISGTMVQLLGVSEKQYETWVEMEMAQFSTLIHCRKCNQSAFVDKEDLEGADDLRCPAPGCDHMWCKKCQQSIVANGAKHSCDGSAELDHLMQQQGWKYCPNCKTPIQKQDGCNHMSCVAPGCNTQFCYRCGATISRTAVPREIAEEKTRHFRTCQLF